MRFIKVLWQVRLLDDRKCCNEIHKGAVAGRLVDDRKCCNEIHKGAVAGASSRRQEML